MFYKMLFILLFIAMALLDWKLDTSWFFKVMGTLLLFFIALSIVDGKSIQSETPIRTESFVVGGFTNSYYGDKKCFTYSNENGTFEIPADSTQMKEWTKNEIKTYKTSYPKVYKYLFFSLHEGEYYKVDIKP